MSTITLLIMHHHSANIICVGAHDLFTWSYVYHFSLRCTYILAGTTMATERNDTAREFVKETTLHGIKHVGEGIAKTRR